MVDFFEENAKMISENAVDNNILGIQDDTLTDIDNNAVLERLDMLEQKLTNILISKNEEKGENE